MALPVLPLPPFPPRPPAAHKGTFGHALLIGGSQGMAGAVALAAIAALRTGAGLATAAVPEGIAATVAGFEPAVMTRPLPQDRAGRLLPGRVPWQSLWQRATSVGVGPGLGRSLALSLWLRDVLVSAPLPLVLDADALNALAPWAPELLWPEHAALTCVRTQQKQQPWAAPRIFTPHPGELRRLLGDRELTSAQLCAQAVEFARAWRVVLVLKGHRTLVTDGERVHYNTTGNPGMATGGSGDVLTGAIAALVAQGLAPFEAAQLGVHVHGRAGDLAAAELSEPGLIASDLLRYLPRAIGELSPGD